MISTRGDARPVGFVTGCLIALGFGTVFIVVNSDGPPAPWPVLIRAAGTGAAGVMLALLQHTVRTTRPPAATTGRPGFADPRYWIIVAAESVALFCGLYLINGVWGHPEAGVAWVATVVGVHFVVLARAWRMPDFHRLGAAQTALGLAGFAIHALDGPDTAISMVAGVGSGVALLTMVAVALRRYRA